MRIKLTPGNLYFIRDEDYLTGEVGKYIKIGIVTKSRTTEKRMKEHQTGNPRGIYPVHELKDVPFVERLETHIHYEHNEKWITGEWFLMDKKEAKAVYERAKALKKEQLAIQKTVYKALEKLIVTKSNGKIKRASKSAKDLETKLLNLKTELNILAAQIEISKHTFYKEMGANGAIEGVVRIKYTPPGLTFDEAAFKKAHPKIYKKYTVKKSDQWDTKFVLSNVKDVSLAKINPTLNATKKALNKLTFTHEQLSKTKKRTKKLEKMHIEHLALLRKAKLYSFEYEMIKYELQNLVGAYEGIEGICTWPRSKHKAADAFDTKKFKDTEPELYERFCTKPRKEVFAMDVEKFRPYKPK